MSTRASNWFETKYVAGAMHVLQTDGYLLKGTYQDAAKIETNLVTWKLAGKGDATEMSTSIENRPTMNAARTTVTAAPKDYEANEWINHTDLNKMTENEQQIAQQTAGYAMGRKFDQVLIAAMDAEAGNITTIGDGSANVSILDMMTAQAAILSQGIIGSPEIFAVIPFTQMAVLNLFARFNSADYVGPQNALTRKLGARTWQGVHYIPAPDAYFAVPSSNKYDFYMWLKPCLGFNSTESLMSRIDYVPEKKAYFAANTMNMVGKVLMPEGIRRIRMASNVALTVPSG